MAIQRDILRFTGRIGTLVGRKGLDGKYTASVYQPIVHQPGSDKQTESQSALALSAKVAGFLGALGEQVNIANGYAATRRGLLIRDIYALVKDADAPANGSILPAALPLVHNPQGVIQRRLSLAITPPRESASGSVALSWNNTTEENDTLVRNVAAIILYNNASGEWRSTSAFLTPNSTSLRIYFPSAFVGSHLVAYGYLLGVLAGGSSALYEPYSLGTLQGTDDAMQILNDADVLVGNYKYTQVESVVLSSEILPS